MAKCDRPLAGGDWESSVRPGGVSTWANWLRGFQRNVRRRHRGFWSSSSPLPRSAVANVRRRYVSSKHRMIRKRHAPNRMQKSEAIDDDLVLASGPVAYAD